MVAMAYGASFAQEPNQFTESITSKGCLLRFKNCSEGEAVKKVMAYHEKCITIAIQYGYTTEPFYAYDDSIKASRNNNKYPIRKY